MEILAGDSFETAVREFNLDAKKTFGNSRFEVWDISQGSLDALNSIPDEEWKEDYGWYRFSGGCNISHYPTHEFYINENKMIGFYDPCQYEPYLDYVREHKYSGEQLSSIDHNFFFHYIRLTVYLCDMFGISTETNICSVCVDLAKLNNMTMAELFEKFEGCKDKYE